MRIILSKYSIMANIAYIAKMLNTIYALYENYTSSLRYMFNKKIFWKMYFPYTEDFS